MGFFVRLALVITVLLSVMVVGLSVGAVDIPLKVIAPALWGQDESFDALIVSTIRLPRVLTGALVGMALAVSGALMQGLTQNPLASPGILGINAGSAFAVVCALVIWGQLPLASYAIFAAIGAAVAAVLVYSLASMGAGGVTPMKMTLAGAIFTALLTAITTSMLIFDEETLEQVRFWTAGSLAGREMALLVNTAPYVMTGLVIGILLGKPVSAMSLGEAVAAGLGQQTQRIRLWAFAAVVLLSGGATALAGPIAFVGLMVPHIARFWVGTDYRRVLPMAAVIGALMVSAADILGRLVIRPQELPVGIIMGLLGAPFFIYLARRQR